MIKFNAVTPISVETPETDFEPISEDFLEHAATESSISGAAVAAAEPDAGAPVVEPKPTVTEKPPTEASRALMEGSKNLLKHIPGEASGFYLMAVDSIPNPGLGALGVAFVLALILLILVRYLAGASKAIMVTTILAFLLWMLVLENGVLNAAFPDLLPDPWGLIAAFFYSTVITLLASAGKIQ